MAQNSTQHTFEDEVFFNIRKQRNIFAWLCLLCLLIALASVSALVAALPFKEIRPYVVMVDRQTGMAEQITATRPANLAERDAVREAELVRYVTDRETYDPADNAERIPVVLQTSDGQAADSLRALWNASNEDFPPDRYGRTVLIEVEVRNINQLDDSTAQVRFTRRLERPGETPIERSFVATVGYEFRPRVERRLEDVWRNPLGFTVTNYRIAAETLSERRTGQ
ncbi:virB8 family protein [Phaeobacter inhibens]|uniref:virB8 family protein n=1 Tax=Phaeobacter inhibens TaxID=221822 RepID=UPI0021A5AA73|nr:type IV secretion system protein [Phaeobacter inhibens]UWR62805.1 type IV secretion system protein [Phaeobacter inhibens]